MSKHLSLSVSNMTEREKTVVFVKKTQKRWKLSKKTKIFEYARSGPRWQGQQMFFGAEIIFIVISTQNGSRNWATIFYFLKTSTSWNLLLRPPTNRVLHILKTSIKWKKMLRHALITWQESCEPFFSFLTFILIEILHSLLISLGNSVNNFTGNLQTST